MMKVNLLPQPTWNWLKMNDAVIDEPDVKAGCLTSKTLPSSVKETADSNADKFKEIPGGMGPDMQDFINNKNIDFYNIETTENVNEEKPVKLDYAYTDKVNAADGLNIDVKENSTVTVIMDYTSDDNAGGSACVQTKINAQSNSHILLVQLVRLGDGFTCLSDIGANVADNATVDVIHIVLGGSKTYIGCAADLVGNSSAMTAKTGYMLKEAQHLDMNYVALHKGKKSTSDMYATGVLDDNASKLYRATIDFKRGCKGSKGEEKEEVLLLSDDVRNQTIPLILCAEEDVEGNHGATIGNLDKELLFYLETRGIEEEMIYKMMAESKIEVINSKIPDEDTRNKVSEYLRERKEREK